MQTELVDKFRVKRTQGNRILIEPVIPGMTSPAGLRMDQLRYEPWGIMASMYKGATP